MTKYEWEKELKKSIYRLPEEEVKRVLEYYNELFEDKIEEGLSEKSIILEFGNPIDVGYRILSEYDGDLAAESVPPVALEPQRKVEGIRFHKPFVSAPSEPIKPHINNDFYDNIARQEAEKPKKEPVEQAAYNSGNRDSVNDGDKSGNTTSKQSSGSFRGGRLAVVIVLAVFLGGGFLGCVMGVWGALAGLTISSGAAIIAGAYSIIAALVTGSGATLAIIGIGMAAIGIGILLLVISIKLIKLAAKLTVKFFVVLKNFIYSKKVQYEKI